MPIYEYVCNKCNEGFSMLQSTRACDRDAKCPRCGSHDVKKRVSAFSCSSSSGSSIKHSFGSSGGFGGG